MTETRDTARVEIVPFADDPTRAVLLLAHDDGEIASFVMSRGEAATCRAALLRAHASMEAGGH